MLRPDAGWVADMNRSLAQRLNVALHHIVTEVLGGPDQAAWSTHPCAHALQDRFREAAVRGDLDLLRSIWVAHRDVLVPRADDGQLQILGWGDPALTAAEYGLLQGAFQDDIGLTADLVAPDPAAVAATRDAITRIIDGLAIALPDWDQELRALVRLILLAEAAQARFAGASTFSAWGAFLISPRAHKDDLALALSLIHESAHLKLFCAYLDDEIVLNDPDETYSSPLRREPRPMNGIYHAAFVLARMVQFLHDLDRSGQTEQVVGPEAARHLQGHLRKSMTDFDAAMDVITRHAQLTARGHAIITETANGVQAVAASQAGG
jgi:hypothetical protein